MRYLSVGLLALALITLSNPGHAQTDKERAAYNSGQSGGGISYTASEGERRAYDRGVQDAADATERAAEDQRRGAESEAQRQKTHAEMEEIRGQVAKQPPLPASKNPLLGRWIMIEPKQQGLLDALVNPEAAICGAIFGGEEFEYRPDVLVLGDAGGDIPADKVSYRAGKGGSVFVLGENAIRILLFEFDAGKDRARNGKCIYQQISPGAKGPANPARAAAPPAATPSAAAPSPAAAPARPATPPRTYKGAGFKVAGATLGTDTPPQVSKAITARGGMAAPTIMESLAALRIYGRDANWSDVGDGIYNVAFDFDDDGPAGQLVAVTLVYAADAASLPRIFQKRAAELSAKYGLPTPASATHQEGNTGAVRITLDVDPAASAVMETYRLK